MAMESQDDVFENEDIYREVKEAMNKSQAEGVAKIQEHLDEVNNTPLNIAITGESGSGKSTFVNAFRGVDNRDDRAAPTGCVETTMEVKDYPHPKHPNVTLWDLPGIGTTNFPANKYLKHVGFERFDFFIIISADRFRENDVKLALEIQKMGKKFYFVRSKIDHSLRDEEESQRDFDAEKTLAQIRKYCIKGLEEQGFECPKVFLVSSRHLHLHDFRLLHDTLETELPARKRDALLLAMPNINLEIINKKKEAFKSKIKFHASVSALIASAPVAGLSFAADVAMIAAVTATYQIGFGLDDESLENLALSVRKPVSELRSVMISPLAGVEINKELILKALSMCTGELALMAAEEGSRFIPLFGIPAAMGLSFLSTYRTLNMFLNMLTDDAQRVFKKALVLNTPL